MKVVVKGKDKTIGYDLLDRYDPSTKTSSMARTTGYTCTAAVNLIAKGLFKEKGVFPPELVGKNKVCFDFVMNYLKERNVKKKKLSTCSSGQNTCSPKSPVHTFFNACLEKK